MTPNQVSVEPAAACAVRTDHPCPQAFAPERIKRVETHEMRKESRRSIAQMSNRRIAQAAQRDSQPHAIVKPLGRGRAIKSRAFDPKDDVQAGRREPQSLPRVSIQGASLCVGSIMRPKKTVHVQPPFGSDRTAPSWNRPKRCPGRALYQYNSHTRNRCRPTGQFRPPRHADGAGAGRLHPLAEISTL